MIFLKKVILLFILLFIISHCYSQIFNFRHLTEDNGLPQNYIYSISQSKEGYLFLSTGNGFAAFGGNKFKTFTTKDSLCENFVNIHYTDSRGIIWLGHYQNGITYLKDFKFTKINNSQNFGSKILTFAEDNNKNIWFVVQGKGLFYIDQNYNIKEPVFPSEININNISIDSDNDLLCCTDNGLMIFNLKNINKPHFLYSIPLLENKNITFITKDALNNNFYWIAIAGEGIYGIKKNNNYHITSVISNELNSSTKNILCIYSDKSSNLWISLANEGLKKVNFLDNNIKRFFSVQTINQNNNLQNFYIISISEDFEGNLWFGTFGAGLIQLPVNQFSFFKPNEYSDIKSVLLNKSGSLWLGTKEGLLYFEISNSKTTLYNSKNGFVNDFVSSIFQDKDGLIWVGTEKYGLFTLNNETKIFENFSKKNKLDILSINCITGDKEGNILAGTDEGVYFINPKNSKTVLYTTLEGLLHNNVLNIFCDSKNRIWFCSNGAPPYYLEKNEFVALKDIPTVSVNSVAEDRNGIMWISTEGDGIFSYDDKKITNYKVEDGLLSNFCYSLIYSKNELWVSHKNGLTSVKQSGKILKHFNKSDGLLYTENNNNSCYKDVNGNLWFGTTEGLVNYDFERNNFKKRAPITNILTITLNTDVYTVKDTIDLMYNKYSVKVDYIGISLTEPAKVIYKYRMLGLDTTWRYTKERYIEFPKITEGNYTFQIIACNRDGIWNSKPAEISFEIRLPYWKRIWFWFSLIAILTTIIYFFIRYRINSLIRTKNILEKKVAIKTKQLRQEKEEIERIKVILEVKNKDITDSINYAKRIQLAILPTKEIIFKAFPNTFIYYKPKDIVSGDFYWFAETEFSYIVAVVDCTGHGVPGAFMSLIGSTLLNEIINNNKTVTPSEILTILNRDIVKTLGQNNEKYKSQDGMDISMCSINKSKTKLIFSSAGRPLYYVRNKVLKEINLKSPSIGGSFSSIIYEYKDFEIDIFSNDIIYMFSDGFADQFDFKDEKKFTTKRLKELLTRISGMESCNQLVEVENVLKEWKGNINQIDDITIVGLKI